jgi:predicted transcriptional regulator
MRKLKTLRRDAGLTQYALAAVTGIHRWRISHAELGLVELTKDEIRAIRKVLLDVSRNNSARVLRACSDTEPINSDRSGRLRSA